MHKLLYLLLFSIVVAACARPCPDDINLGAVSFSANTNSFIPQGQLTDKMSFTNPDTGKKLEFANQNDSKIDRYQLDVETLCERGDFLDKTVQTNYYHAHSMHLYYTTADNTYTLAVDAQIENNGPYGSKTDTVLYETFSCWGQKLIAPTKTGTFQLMASDRGNTAKLLSFKENYEKYRFVADTVIGNRPLSGVWTNKLGTDASLFMFYSKARGLEAFTTADEVWLRD